MERYYMDIQGLIDRDGYTYELENYKITFEKWNDKKVNCLVFDYDGNFITDFITSSLKVVNKNIKKYGLQFTQI